MVNAKLNLLGSPEIFIDGESVSLGTRKSVALLAYLAVTESAHSRDSLAALLWPEHDQTRARTYLRQAFHALTKRLGTTDFQADRQMLGMAPGPSLEVDVHRFRRHLQSAHAYDSELSTPQALAELAQAVALFHGDFMAGFNVPDSAPFEEWQTYQRTTLQREAAGAMLALAYGYGRQGNFQIAIERAHRCLNIDPLDESAHRCLMTLYAWSGQQVQATRQYAHCVRLLDDELGILPSNETSELMEKIRARKVVQPGIGPPKKTDESHASGVAVANVSDRTSTRRPQQNLPRLSTPFVGRIADIESIGQRLVDPGCRLITIVGPGGIGKTQLAIAVADHILDAFADGLLFVQLATLSSPDLLFSSILSSMGSAIQSSADPDAQLLRYLSKRKLLLVLDNFEHLISGVDLVRQIMQEAPNVRVLVTSRERLHLQDEWIYSLDGLQTPPDDLENKAESLAVLGAVDSVKLFVTLAQRTQQNIRLTAENAPFIARICRMLDGNPLALQLASAWTRILSIDEIARELSDDARLLRSTWRDMAHRHRSMQAVFDYSWKLLAEQEQCVLGQLSVFEPGFSRAAASAVAGADLDTLSALADKSWIHISDQGRLEIHDLTRRFLTMLTDDQPQAATRKRYCEYYAAFLQNQVDRWRGADEIEALSEIVAEWDNLRQAWHWAIEHRNFNALDRMADSLQWAAEVRGWHREALDLFGPAVDIVQAQIEAEETIPRERVLEAGKHDQVLARLLCCQAHHAFALGRLRKAEGLCRQGIAVLTDLPVASQLQIDAYLRLALAITLIDLRRLEEAATTAEKALSAFSQLEDSYGKAWAVLTIGIVIHESGDNQGASVHFQQVISLGEQIGSQRIIAYGGGMMATICHMLGDYELALDHLERSKIIRKRFGDWHGIAYCVLEQGLIAGELGNLTQSIELLRQSLAISEDIGERVLQCRSLGYLGAWHYFDANLDESLHAFRRGLALVEQKRDQSAGRAWLQAGLALTLDELGLHEEARGNLKTALRAFRATSAPEEVLVALTISGKILADEGQVYEAGQVLAFVEQSTTTIHFFQKWARDLSTGLPLSAAQREAAMNAARTMSLQEQLEFACSVV